LGDDGVCRVCAGTRCLIDKARQAVEQVWGLGHQCSNFLKIMYSGHSALFDARQAVLAALVTGHYRSHI
jgi:hypothetical protein